MLQENNSENCSIHIRQDYPEPGGVKSGADARYTRAHLEGALRVDAQHPLRYLLVVGRGWMEETAVGLAL